MSLRLISSRTTEKENHDSTPLNHRLALFSNTNSRSQLLDDNDGLCGLSISQSVAGVFDGVYRPSKHHTSADRRTEWATAGFSAIGARRPRTDRYQDR